MENAIVAVSNGVSSQPAKKFWVELSPNFGQEQCALANQVFFKDGLVLLEGVVGIRSIESKVKPLDILSWEDGWHRGYWRGPLQVCVEKSSPAHAKYGRTYASLVVDRKCVGRVEGLSDVEGLTLPWFRTMDEAQKMADDEQIKANDLIRQRNAEKIGVLADKRRQDRAYLSWEALPWPIRVLTPRKWYTGRFPSSPDDREWAMSQADKLRVDYGV